MMSKVSARAAREQDNAEWEHPWMPLLDIPVAARAIPSAGPVLDGLGASLALLLVAAIGIAVAPEPVMRAMGSRTQQVRDWVAASTSAQYRELEIVTAEAIASQWTAVPSVRGTMRLWPETVREKNYDVRITGDLAKGTVGCVFRAMDANNYYAAQVRRAGRGAGRVEHWAVVNGTQSGIVSTPVERLGAGVELGVAVREDRFVLSVDGRPVDSWRDPRFPIGGAGVQSTKGAAPVESARLRLEVPPKRHFEFWGSLEGRLAQLLALSVPAR